MTLNRSTKVAVAMSGGVDSSVAAGLLIKEGYDVYGISMRLWRYCPQRMNAEDPLERVQAVANKLGIRLEIIDYEDVFYERVVGSYLNDLKQGLTPNPCLVCNRSIKWGELLEHVQGEGADYLASGHYARLERDTDDQVRLYKGLDTQKDQSYVLSVLSQAQLKRAILPLGMLHKADVKQMAEDMALPMQNSLESQDLCFLNGENQRDFLRQFAPEMLQPGLILDQNGKELGEHEGLAFYTIGQRKGLRIAAPRPLYVLRKDLELNQLVVGYADELETQALLAVKANWITEQTPQSEKQYQVKIRYRAKPVGAKIKLVNNDRFIVQFEEGLRDITPGQRAVVYDGELCLGSGEIKSSLSLADDL